MDRGACMYINTFVNICIYKYLSLPLVKLYKISFMCDVSDNPIVRPGDVFDDRGIWIAIYFFKASGLLIYIF